MIRHDPSPALVIVAILTLIPLAILVAHWPIEVALMVLLFAYVLWITHVVNLAVRLADRAWNGRNSR
ncbi:hypothetical protein [Rhodococcus qingshengii]|uniref:hypothetical protein n=1 Tax=Rhodococcus qingshengii TaxID=334542 RepID=UPI00210E8969|nr:hypothetical protein [Rhodococcus qingshengii]MCQ4148598.1 hypothetical protein [Rhodococcus qingshengii]